MIQLSCPHCGYTKEIPDNRIPAGVTRVKCPKCQKPFPLEPATTATTPPESAQPTSTAPAEKTDTVILTCPHCGSHREVPRAKIPRRVAKALCKQCQLDFSFNGEQLLGNTPPAGSSKRPSAISTAAAPHAAGLQSRQQLATLGELFTRTWDGFKRRILTLIGINLLAVTLAVLAYFLLGAGIGLLQQVAGDNPAVMLVAGLILFGFSMLVVTAIGAAMIYAIVNDDMGVKQALVCGIKNIIPFLWVFTLLGFILVGGYLAFFIPGLLFTTWFIFAQFILARDGVRGMDALLMSRAYVRGHGLGVFGRILLIGLLGSVVSAIPIVGLIAGLFLGPYTMIFYHEIFLDLREIKGSVVYSSSRGAKAKWLFAGATGYIIIPLAALLIVGPTLFQNLDMLRSQTGFGSLLTPPKISLTPSTQAPPAQTTNAQPAGINAKGGNSKDGDLSLSRSDFAPYESVVVEFRAPAGLATDAWVGIIPSHVPHGDESRNDQHDLTYQYLSGRSSGSLQFSAPSQPGNYDLRMHDTDSSGKEIASVSFRVTSPNATPVVLDNGPHSLKLERTSFNPGEPINLKFSGIKNPVHKDWVSLYPIGAKNQNYGEYHYLKSRKNGELQFTAPQKPGRYEFRLFLNWPDGGYRAAARSQQLTVSTPNVFESLPASKKPEPVTRQPEPTMTPTSIIKETQPKQSPSTIRVPMSGDNPDQVMIYIYAMNYLGSVRLNGQEIYPIKGERDMNYNYNGSVTLKPGSNIFVLDYQALPDDPWMTKIQLKVSRYDWGSGKEAVFGDWTYKDTGSKRRLKVVLGN